MVGTPEIQAAMFVAQASEPTIPQPLRAILLMALLGIVILGIFLILGAMLGAHWVRRLGRFRRGPAVPTDVGPLRPRNSKQVDVGPSKDQPDERVDTVVSRDRPAKDTNNSP